MNFGVLDHYFLALLFYLTIIKYNLFLSNIIVIRVLYDINIFMKQNKYMYIYSINYSVNHPNIINYLVFKV